MTYYVRFIVLIQLWFDFFLSFSYAAGLPQTCHVVTNLSWCISDAIQKKLHAQLEKLLWYIAFARVELLASTFRLHIVQKMLCFSLKISKVGLAKLWQEITCSTSEIFLPNSCRTTLVYDLKHNDKVLPSLIEPKSFKNQLISFHVTFFCQHAIKKILRV